MGLDEDGAALRIETGCQEVERHIANVLAKPRGIGIVRRQGVKVGDEKVAVILVLELDPVVKRAHVVAKMEPPSGSHAAEDAGARRGEGVFSHYGQLQG